MKDERNQNKEGVIFVGAVREPPGLEIFRRKDWVTQNNGLNSIVISTFNSLLGTHYSLLL